MYCCVICLCFVVFFFSSRRRHTICALVTGVQTCALPISFYQQIQTGVADGAIIIPTGAYSLKLHEVAPHVTLVDMGVTTIGGFAVNRDTWDSLPEDVQTVLGDLAREYSRVRAEQVAARYVESLANIAAERYEELRLGKERVR